MLKNLVAGLAIALFTFAGFASAQSDVGSAAPEFKLKNVDGQMVALSDYKKAKGVILIFSCNHCPWVKKYEDRYIALNKKYSKQGFPVVAISSNDPVSHPEDSYENMIKRHKEKGYGFAYLYDETQEIAKKYGAEKTPHAYLLVKKGDSFTIEYIGAIDDNPSNEKLVKERYVEEAIAAVLAGKKPAVAKTKAIGCGIKWKAS
jgi:peroxiredoxin